VRGGGEEGRRGRGEEENGAKRRRGRQAMLQRFGIGGPKPAAGSL